MVTKRRISLSALLAAILLLQGCVPKQSLPADPAMGISPAQTANQNNTENPLTVDDVLGTCPTIEEIESIDSRIEIVFKGDPTTPDLVCTAAAGSKDLTLLQKNVYNTFRVMQHLQFDLPLPWTDLQLFDWFTQATHGVVFDSKAKFSHCCDDEHRIVIQSQYILVAQTDLWIDSSLGGAGVNSLLPMLIHEARHAEGLAHRCTTSVGNDVNLQEMGAWAVEYYYDLWITDHPNAGFFNDYYREISHANAELILYTRFCQGEILNP